MFEQVCERIGLPVLRTRDLGTQRLGHSSPPVTMSIYAHAMPGQGEAAAGFSGDCVTNRLNLSREVEGTTKRARAS